eukprot:3559066-Pyramimonas_sp.AAC.2
MVSGVSISAGHHNSIRTDNVQASLLGSSAGVRVKAFCVDPVLLADGVGLIPTIRMARAPHNPRQKTNAPPGP